VSELEDRLEYDHLKAFCWAAGFHAEIHKHFRPELAALGREKAMWYLQRSRKENPTVAPHELSILKFALASEVYDWVNEYRKAESAA
jgi:hypothetical protein